MRQFITKSGKYTGIYRGVVIDNNDPSQYGRMQIRVLPMFNGVTDTDLPWAIPAYGLFDGAGAGTGAFVIPKVGTYVYVFFEEGDVYQPVYFAEAQNAVYGLPVERLVDYPNMKVFKSAAGHVITIDDQTGSEDIKVLHPTGTYEEWLPNGNHDTTSTTATINELAKVDINNSAENDINSTAVNDITETAGNDVTVAAGNDITESADNDILMTAVSRVNTTAGTTITISAAGDITIITDTGKLTVTATADDIDISTTSSGDINITSAGNVNIN